VSERVTSWVDGVPAGSIPVDDRGLQYGDGLFETMRVRAGRVRFLDAHLARLVHGCERLAIPVPDIAGLRAELRAAGHAGGEDAILKLIVTRGSGPRGYAARGSFVPRRILSLHAAGGARPAAEGVSLRFARATSAENAALAGLKHLNRLENVLAASEPGHESHFDSLLLDAAGRVVSGTHCNVFLVVAGRLVTPSLERAGVAGVVRGIVLRECAGLGLECEVRDVPAGEIRLADEVFVTNARIGVVAVRSVGEHACTMNATVSRIAGHVDSLDA
jgi:4-amino-4-deoxychorismate lyase